MIQAFCQKRECWPRDAYDMTLKHMLILYGQIPEGAVNGPYGDRSGRLRTISPSDAVAAGMVTPEQVPYKSLARWAMEEAELIADQSKRRKRRRR